MTHALVQDFLQFVNASPSPYHAVETAVKLLTTAGFSQLSESASDAHWTETLKPNSRIFVTRNQSTVVALAVGGQYQPGNGFTVIGAHTDSPVLRVKPISKRSSEGCLQVGVECYGGGLWNTWFDRDLSVAGRVIVQENDQFHSRLVRIDQPILRVPNLAIHLNRDIYKEGFKPNFETHCLPLLATELNSSKGEEKEDESVDGSHHSLLLDILAKELDVNPDQIKDFELSLYDVQPSCVGGALNEFIFSARLDNLCMSFCSLRAMLDSLDDSLEEDTNIRVVALFDHEEIGSSSAQGAASNMMFTTMERVAGLNFAKQAIRSSFLISADMAHAVHPNYASKHESKHRPQMQKGLVLKYNCKQRYATNAETAFILKELARRHEIPIQEFVVRNDMGCGSTIGPILAANTGIRTVDVGIPQLAMHSIREMCGTDDIVSTTDLFRVFYNEFGALDASIHIDE